MTTKIMQKLLTVALEAIEYVGSANYAHREASAKRAVTVAFNAALKGKAAEVVFTPERYEEGAIPEPAKVPVADQLAAMNKLKAEDLWAEFPAYPRAPWILAVADHDTHLGYWEWVEHQIESNG